MSYAVNQGQFIFDDVDSQDYGVYITGENAYNAAKKRDEEVVIPGRNGTLTYNDADVFDDVELVYPAFIPRNYTENIRGLRNALSSKHGKKRLTDSYHPDEYMLAKYVEGLEAETAPRAVAGAMDIIFTRDPRRFLVTGETPVELGAWGQTETDTGDTVTIDNDGTEAVKALSVAITPKQAGSGTPSPDNVRAISGYDSVNVYVSPTTSTADADVTTVQMPSTIYGGTLDVVSGVLTVDKAIITLDGTTNTVTEWGSNDVFIHAMGTDMLKTDDDWSGLILSDKLPSVASAQTLRTSKYGVSGAAANASQSYIYIGNNLSTTAAEMNTWLQSNPMTVVYPLANPQTYTLTPTQVELLTGVNNIWSDAGAVTVEHGENPNVLVNPTLFEARPLIRVYGYGTLTIGDMTVTVALSQYAYIDIDSEMMDCYHEDDNANGYVSFSTGDFPTLPAGTTALSYTNTITKVEVTPHWWRL